VDPDNGTAAAAPSCELVVPNVLRNKAKVLTCRTFVRRTTKTLFMLMGECPHIALRVCQSQKEVSQMVMQDSRSDFARDLHIL
jgi:hypothetical protein